MTRVVHLPPNYTRAKKENASELSARERLRSGRISQEQLGQSMMSDPRTIAGVDWLRQHSQEYPTREDLTSRGLTELSYLGLQTDTSRSVLRSVAGGAASKLAVEIWQHDIEERASRGETEFHVLAMTHGAIAPNALSLTEAIVNHSTSPQLRESRQRILYGKGTEDGINSSCAVEATGHHAHNNYMSRDNGDHWSDTMTCGAGGEHELGMRTQSAENVGKLLEWAKSKGYHVKVTAIEAIVTFDSNEPEFLVLDSTDFTSTKAFQDAIQAPGDNYRQPYGQDPCGFGLSQLKPAGYVNDLIRESMQANETIVGAACADARNGIFVPPANIERFPTEAFPEFGASESLNGTYHSESYGVILAGNDTDMQQVAYYLATHAQAISRVTPDQNVRNFAIARPFVVNIPQAVFEKHAAAIREATLKLLALVDTTHRNAKPGSAAKYFIADGSGNLVQVDTDPGLQFFLPESGLVAEVFEGAEVRRPNPFRVAENWEEGGSAVNGRNSMEFPRSTSPAQVWRDGGVPHRRVREFAVTLPDDGRWLPPTIPGTGRKLGVTVPHRSIN